MRICVLLFVLSSDLVGTDGKHLIVCTSAGTGMWYGRGKDGGKDANFLSISKYSWKLIALIYLTNDQYNRTGTDCVVHHPQNVDRISPASCMSRYCLYVALCWTLRLATVTWCVHLVLVMWLPSCNVICASMKALDHPLLLSQSRSTCMCTIKGMLPRCRPL